jgi:hypothetical protein
VHHAELGLGAVELELQNLLVYRVASLLRDARNGALCAGRKHDLVVVEETVLENGSKDVTASDVVADLELARGKVPLLLAVQSRQVDAAGDVNAVRAVGDALEGALDTVVDSLHQTGTELDGQWLPRPEDRVANSHTSCMLSALLSLIHGVAYQSLRRPGWWPCRCRFE